MRRKLIFYRTLSAILMVVLAVVVSIMFYRNYTQTRAGEVYNELQMQVNTPTPTVAIIDETTEAAETEEPAEEEPDYLASLGISVPEKYLDWESLRATNEEIYAWIYIPDTNIDYPVLQNAEDDEYYLEHNLDGSTGYPGCIFTQALNQKNFSDSNTIIYGHNMQDGTMFRTLHYYQNEEFFYNDPYIYIYTEDGVLVYWIFAAYNAGDEHILHTYDCLTVEGFSSYLATVQEIAQVDGYIRDDVAVTASSHIITLSTCTDIESERYLVQAVLLNDDSADYAPIVGSLDVDTDEEE